MKQIPLRPKHEALGASFTDFGGWEMPVRYSSDLAEHHAVREAAGLFDTFYGILIAIVSILVEGPLAYKKLKIGKESNNLIIIAEAKETLFCLNLSVLVIVGVGVNYLTNLWYFDPVAALLMIPWLIYEFNQHR